ncbi:GTPase ObgE [Candidatus Saccharibacteria bacterium]|nr:MAG: GTPase ObgE [Candidatus Saccharibacteria bacterium]
MKFIDVADVQVAAGDGGSGRVSFRHEKFVDRGGPDGGDGGKGGDIVFVASRNHNTLMDFRYHKSLAAEKGGDGSKIRKHGRNGGDLRVSVPVGTVVLEDDVILVDLSEDGQEAIIAAGGRGGFGNAHFVSSVRQAPKFAEPGGEGEIKNLKLELKLIADVGLVGLPNAGKSTFLSVVSNARPEIADYPFTTLTPNLGVADVPGAGSVLIADIPGLIEGAAEGKGLGDEFLRHVERTAVLLHLVDVTSNDIVADYKTIENEVKLYSAELASRAKMVVLTKTDASLPELVEEATETLRKIIPPATPIFAISSQAHSGVKILMYSLVGLVTRERQKTFEEAAKAVPHEGLPVLTLKSEEPWSIEKTAEKYLVSGHKIDKFAARTDFGNEESIARLRDIMRKMGISHKLSRMGAKAGDRVQFKKGSFEL